MNVLDAAIRNLVAKIHVGRILARLGLRDRVQAVVLAYESGLITPGDAPARRTRRQHSAYGVITGPYDV
jgi:hypothetical protein